MYKCPKCGSARIDQYRMPVGPMWCSSCKYRVEDKNQVPNPFVDAALEAAQKQEKDEKQPVDDQEFLLSMATLTEPIVYAVMTQYKAGQIESYEAALKLCVIELVKKINSLHKDLISCMQNKPIIVQGDK